MARQAIMIALDVTGVAFTYAAAFLLRFDFRFPPGFQRFYWETLPVLLVVYLTVFVAFRLYQTMWSFFGPADLPRLGFALVTASAAAMIAVTASEGWTASVGSVLLLQFFLMGLWTTSERFAVRRFRERWLSGNGNGNGADPATVRRERVLIVGNTSHAELLIRAGRLNEIGRIVGIVPDDPRGGPLTLHGVPVGGTVENVGEVAHRSQADVVLILPPFTARKKMNEIIGNCAFAKQPCRYRLVPSLADLASGHLKASAIRDVHIDDLLGRDPVRLDGDLMYRFVWDRTVMVTGAGGSIGSQICRQIARFKPAALMLFDISEIALFTIENELRRLYPDLNLIARIGDIRDEHQVVNAIDDAGGVDIVYHAAAYKHVFLMERNVPSAFQTNVLGTECLARIAASMGVDRFVMISSDKAVRPTSIMGTTKRIAERVIHELPPNQTKFVSVRFGNVLDSSGSVIPIFRKQIADGGPVTVTSENVRRYFMSIPEAVDLVLMAGTLGAGGDIMVLDMGDPVRILDLAKRMIELSGFVPDVDIGIEITGLRPGEKEYEEVMTQDENVVPSSIDRICVLRKNPSADWLPPIDLPRIAQLIRENDTAALREVARELVPENHLPELKALSKVG